MAAQEDNALPYLERDPVHDIAPQFPGGSDAMMRFLRDSIRYPEPEWTQRKQGNVLVKFNVTRRGTITAIRVVNGVTGAPNLARETERVVASMPKWIPATKKGKRVEAEVQISVPFALRRKAR